MKIVLSLADFIKAARIDNYTDEGDMFNHYYSDRHYDLSDFKDSIFNSVELNGIKYDTDRIVELAENDSELEDAISRAMYSAEESGYCADWAKAQVKALDEWLDSWSNQIEYILEQEDGAKPCIKTAYVDERMQQVIIECDARKAGMAIVQILHGEGMFYSEGYKGWLSSGPYTPTQFVESHMHYFLNQKLIDSIWGFIKSPHFDIDDRYFGGSFDKEYFNELIKEAVSESIDRKTEHTKKMIENRVPLAAR